ncbi:MAG: hypothetical protein JWO37_2104 [Acidimicrobiales bacterium]|jgi:hypothetical protein|nr:hypothetical protein [Acidimicrobiales bacterium]
MTAGENRGFENLLLLCLPHASEADDTARVADHPPEKLREWKRAQIAEYDAIGLGWNLKSEDYERTISDSVTITDSVVVDSSTVSLGGQGGQAPGAGGGGGGALGSGAIAGDGGQGGQIVRGAFRAEDLPDVVQVKVGRGGLGGRDGADGGEGGDTAFGELVARGGKGGLGAIGKAAGVADSLRARLNVVAVLFANAVDIRDGLVFVLAGGWDFYDMPADGRLSAGLLVAVQVAPAKNPRAGVLGVRLASPDGAVRWESPLAISLDPSETTTTLSFPLQVNVEDAPSGDWTVSVHDHDGEVLGSAMLDVRAGWASTSDE